jgi:hypothetical protein
MKILVHGIYVLEVIQTVLMVDMGFRNFVTRFGDVEVFNQIETMWFSVPILTAIGKFSHERPLTF